MSPSDVTIEAGFFFIESGIDVHRHEGFVEGADWMRRGVCVGGRSGRCSDEGAEFCGGKIFGEWIEDKVLAGSFAPGAVAFWGEKLVVPGFEVG